jgi:hypothetical protein
MSTRTPREMGTLALLNPDYNVGGRPPVLDASTSRPTLVLPSAWIKDVLAEARAAMTQLLEPVALLYFRVATMCPTAYTRYTYTSDSTCAELLDPLTSLGQLLPVRTACHRIYPRVGIARIPTIPLSILYQEYIVI